MSKLMNGHHPHVRTVAFVADYLPRKCGIATFTHDLRNAVADEFPEAGCPVVAINDNPRGYAYPSEVRFEVEEQDLASYRRAADYLNFGNCDVVCLQHEFGIFGGQAGSHILAFARELRMPLVTTLHTVLRDPDPEQRRVMEELTTLSARLIVMSERGKSFLTDIYGVPEEKIDLIAHGIPDMPFVDPTFYKDQFDVEGKQVLLTFGLLSPNKGIENVIRALPKIVKEFPDLVYIVLGATHPNLVKEAGESYRESLVALAAELGVARHVQFHNRFVELEELKEYIGAADLYITPYLNPAQITSGTLAYAFGSGKAVISTPYWHAEELLAEERGVLVPFGDSEAIAQEVISLMQDDTRRHAMRKRAYLLGREMVWSHTAYRYMESFQKARASRPDAPFALIGGSSMIELSRTLPELRLDHLRRMTDSTGLLEHASFSLPNYQEGYTTDDNARALILSVLLEDTPYETRETERLQTTYAAFLNYAFNTETKRFRNCMDYNRVWTEEVASEDSHGRGLWALGVCVGRSGQRDLRMWASQRFDQALPGILDTTSPRAWAFALFGIHEYLRQMSGDRRANQIRDVLTARLMELYEKTADADWHWFEDVVSYDNAVLPHALLLSGRWTSNTEAFEIGQMALRWLAQIQTTETGHFRPIGSNGFYRRGETRADFDQQPLEAGSMVSACLEAYRSTREEFWREMAHRAFNWFLGRNDLALEIYDVRTAGCRDGLHTDRVNQNQGAESTLAFLMARLEMESLENAPGLLRQPDTVRARKPTVNGSSRIETRS